MRPIQFWWRTLVFSSQYNPPWFVELLMTGLAIGLLMSWEITKDWPYLLLSSSYAIGAAMSMWVRETLMPSPHLRVMQILAILLLIYSFCSFSDLAVYLN
jgi:hypothetical protein